jgi:hypothetical protein
MARNKNTTVHLRSTTRGASLTEYTVLTGLLGAVALGAVLAFGINVQDNTETIQARVDSVAALANGAAPGDGGSAGPGAGGGTTPPAPTPPVDLFASCEAGYGPNAAAIRGNGDGSLLSGGNGNQIIYALANAQVDGGEGGTDQDILMVPGSGAVATFDTVNPETGRVDLPGGGAVVFGNIETVVLCDEGGVAAAGGVLETFGFVLVWDEAFPNRSAVIPHIATADEPLNPFAAGVGVIHQTHTPANGMELTGTTLYSGGPLFDSLDGAYGEVLFTPVGGGEQFMMALGDTVPVVQPFYLDWLPVYQSEIEGLTDGTPKTPEVAASIASAHLASLGFGSGEAFCGDRQPRTIDGVPTPLVASYQYWSPLVGAPAGRHIFQVVCSTAEDASAVQGSAIPVVGSFYPFD